MGSSTGRGRVTYTIDGTPFTLTVRQSLSLYLHYEVGMSKRAIGRNLGVSHTTIRRDIEAAQRSIAGSLPVECATLHVLVEGCFSTWCASEQHQMPRGGVLWRDDLADSLEALVAKREAALAGISELMGAKIAAPTSAAGNHWDQWELRWLTAHPGERSIPDADPDPKHRSPYNAAVAARYCASDPATCRLDCCGCRRTR